MAVNRTDSVSFVRGAKKLHGSSRLSASLPLRCCFSNIRLRVLMLCTIVSLFTSHSLLCLCVPLRLPGAYLTAMLCVRSLYASCLLLSIALHSSHSLLCLCVPLRLPVVCRVLLLSKKRCRMRSRASNHCIAIRREAAPVVRLRLFIKLR